MNEEQVWVKGKWYLKVNRPASPDDTGFGHTSAQVAAFRSPDAEVLLGYHQATLDQTRQYLSGLTLKDLDRQLNETWYNPPPTVGVRIISIMVDSLQHSGEIAYLRGLLKGKGWLGA